MNRLGWIAVCTVLAATYHLPVHGEDGHGEHQPGTEEATDVKSIRGEIIDITCAIRHDAKGPEHRKCGIYCANLGMPLGLLEDGTGKIYLILPSGHGDPKEAVLPFIAKRVEVEAIVYASGDLTGIEVVEISALAEGEGVPAEDSKAGKAPHSH